MVGRWFATCLATLSLVMWAPPAAGAEGPSPIPVLLALDNNELDWAAQLIEPLIEAHPAHTGLRMVRAEVQAAMDPWAFAAAVAQPGGAGPYSALHPPPTVDEDSARRAPTTPMALPSLGETRADRWEALYRLILRARHERIHYQGDGPEPPEAFIDRMAALAAATLTAVEADAPQTPWGRIARWEVMQWTAPSPTSIEDALGQNLSELSDAERAFVDWQLLEAIERDDLKRYYLKDALVDSPLVWSQRAAIMLMDASIHRTPWDARPDRWRELATSITEPTLIDDVQLHLARELMQQVDGLEDAWALLRPLRRGPWNNSTTNVTRSVGAYLRRVGDDDAVLANYEDYNKSLPAWGEPILRQYGRALYRLGHYGDSVIALTQLVESPRGQGRDYLYLADAHRFVTSPAFALQLLEFASAVRENELAVEGWRRGWAPQLIAAKTRLFEATTTARHARVFPATFVSMASTALLDPLAIALGLIVLAAFPRLSARAWRVGVTLAIVGLALQGALVWAHRGDEMALGPVATASLLGYGTLRTFFIGGAAVVLAASLGLPGLGLLRAVGRRLRGGSSAALVRRLGAFGLGLATLGLLTAFFAAGVDDSAYLARLPGVLSGIAFGAVGLERWETTGALIPLYHLLTFELLMRGLILGLVALGLRGLMGTRRGLPGHSWAILGAIFLVAALSAAVSAGLGAPPDDAFWLALARGIVLGWVTVEGGIDSAIGAQLGANILWGAP